MSAQETTQAPSAGVRAISYIATVGPVGFSPIAPGTAGSAVAAIFIWLVPLTIPQLMALIVATTIIGAYSADAAEKVFRRKDPGHVVIDEVAGYFIAMAFLPVTPFYVIAAFFVFRFFDIAKVWPCNRLERIKGGWGIMVDDLMAGLYTNIVLQICKAVYQTM